MSTATVSPSRASSAFRRSAAGVLAALTGAVLFLLAGPSAASAADSTTLRVASLTFSPGSLTNPVVGGQAAIATITLTAPAVRGGTQVEIRKFSTTSPIDLPTFGCFSPCKPAKRGLIVVVPEGQTTTTVAIKTFSTATLTQDQVGARVPGANLYLASATLWVTP